jgi:hypothetical protein
MHRKLKLTVQRTSLIGTQRLQHHLACKLNYLVIAMIISLCLVVCSWLILFNSYLSSLLLLWPIRWLKGMPVTFDAWCSLSWLRATNLLWSIILLYVLYSLSRQLHPRDRPARQAWNAFALSLFPVGYFFNFLYYTDTGSTTLVLLAYLLSLKQCHTWASLVSTSYSSRVVIS